MLTSNHSLGNGRGIQLFYRIRRRGWDGLFAGHANVVFAACKELIIDVVSPLLRTNPKMLKRSYVPLATFGIDDALLDY
jgi:hypothetical protein